MPNIDLFQEVGSVGLKTTMGFVNEAYHADLRWPQCQPLFSRMRRSDPEISIVRQVYAALGRGIKLSWELPDNPTDGDKAAAEFAETVLQDISGGVTELAETMVSNVPFFGWGWWEVLPGVRNPKWKAPGEDDWQSNYSDGLIGIRRFAWRDSSSFDHWMLDDASGRLTGMVQQDWPNPVTPIPLDKSLHLTFGDPHNPEGLSPLESVWRLERIKYGLEIVQGIGFEHAAGYLSVNAEGEITDLAKGQVRDAARAIMTAQEGNYALFPKGFAGKIEDVPFSAAPSILEAIKYYGILKLTLYNAQWMALSATTGAGSYSAMNDSSSMWIITYNAMIDGFVHQIDAQIGRRLFAWNAGAFPGMTRRPKLKAEPIQKVISLADLASILAPLKATIPLGEEDFKAIRARAGFLPETLPESEASVSTETIDEDNEGDGDTVPARGASQSTETDAALSSAQRVQLAMEKWREWARVHEPETYALLQRREG